MRLKTLSPQMVRKGLTLALSLSLLTIVVLMFTTSTTKTWATLFAFKPGVIILVAALLCLSWIIEGLRIQLIGRILGENFSLRSILGINLATLFSGNITPFTSGGAPTQIYLLHRSGLSLGKATAVVTLRIALSTLFFTIGGPILIFLFQQEILQQFNLLSWATPIRILLFLALLFSVGVVFILLRPSRGNTFINWLFRQRLVRRLTGDKADAYREGLLKEMTEFHDSVQIVMRRKPIYLLGIMFYTLLYWIVFFSLAPAILLGFGLPVQRQMTRFIFLQFVLLFLLSFIPIPGGSGLAELGFYSVFALYVPKHILAIFVAIWRFISYHLSTLIGGFLFIRLIRPNKPEVDLQG